MRRAVMLFTAVLGALFLFFGTAAGGAWAAEDEALKGTLKNQEKPVAGVRIDVVTEAGAPVGNATTDATGRWEVQLKKQGPGKYKVTLNAATLPPGLQLRDKARGTLNVEVFEGQARTVGFLLDTAQQASDRESGAGGSGQFERVSQLIFEGFNYGLVIALAALGLSLIFGTTGLTNFAHGELLTLGALVGIAFNSAGLPFIAAAAASVFVCGLFGYLQDRFFWGVLRRRGTGLVVTMIISIGVAMFLRHVFLYWVGGGNRLFRDYQGQVGWEIGPISATPKSLVGMAVAIVVIVAVGIALMYTRLGKATRAVSDNPALAASSGINVELVIRLVWTLGAAIAGLAGVIFALSYSINYQGGFAILLVIFAGVTLGGLGTAFGALVGSLVVGLFIQLSTLVVPAEFKNAGALLVLILVLLFRPQGILGRAERVG